ncbi:MAG: hypothetical protein WBA17_12330 [Saprospiraceae bacterium]
MKTFSFYLTLLLLAALLGFTACDRENIESVTEIDLPEDPVVVSVDEPGFFMRMPGNETFLTEGTAFRSHGGFVISSADLNCTSNGGFVLASPINLAQYVTILMGIPVVGDTTTGAVISLGLGVSNLFGCSASVNEVIITELTEDYVEGSFRIELFDRFAQPDPLPPNPTCDNYVSLGIFSSKFAMNYSYCP